MLPAHLQELLTAAVDGELTNAERRLIDKLLRESAEARAFHVQLIADAKRLRDLPFAHPGDDLAAHITNAIEHRHIRPTPLPMPRRKPVWDAQRLLPWISIGTTVCVIIVAGLFSYLYFAASEKHYAQQAELEKTNARLASSPKDLPRHEGRNVPSTDRVAKAEPKQPVNNDSTVVVKDLPKTADPELVPIAPRVVMPENIVATPTLPEMEAFQVVKIRLSLLLALKDLDQPYPRQQLRDELTKDEVIRLDLFCKDSSRAVDLLNAALKSRGQQLLIDNQAHERLKKKQKGEFVYFTESLTVDEIAHLLEQLGADDKKAEIKKAGDGQFDKFMLAPFLPADMAELAKLLGIPASQIKLSKPKAGGIIDPRKSLESVTAAQLAVNLPKAGSRGNEKLALVLPYGVNNHFPQNSKEIKSFLEKRGDRKPATVPMMLVLRTFN